MDRLLFLVSMLVMIDFQRALLGTAKRIRRVGQLLLWVTLPVFAALVFHWAVGPSRNWSGVAEVGVITLAVAYFAYRPITERDLLARYRVRPGYCPRCDYNLTGNTSGRCPECGWTLPEFGPRTERPDWTTIWLLGGRYDIDYLDNPRRTAVYEFAKAVPVCLLMVALLVCAIIRWDGTRLLFAWLLLVPVVYYHITNVRRVIAYRQPEPSGEQEG